MCNTFGDPVCRAHEPAVRADLVAATRRAHEAVATAQDDPDGAPIREAREATARLGAAQARWDQTLTGQGDLRAALADPDLTGTARTMVATRLAVAVRRRDEAQDRWVASPQWAERELASAPGTPRFDRYLAMVAERRAHRGGSCWPRPGEPRGATAWDDSAPGVTYAALSLAGVDHPQVTFAEPAVVDASRRNPPHPGWAPGVAAHYAHLPTVLRPRTFAVAQHLAAHHGRPVRVTVGQLVGHARVEGAVFVDDDGVIPAHDAVAGQRWFLVPVVGPVDVTIAPGRDPLRVRSGVFAVREVDARFLTLASYPKTPAPPR